MLPIDKLPVVIDAIKKLNGSNPSTAGAFFSATGLIPAKPPGEFALFEKTKNTKTMVDENIDANIEDDQLKAAGGWRGQLLWGIIIQQHLNNNYVTPMLSTPLFEAITAFSYSHEKQTQDLDGKKLPPLALYHLGLLLQNEINAGVLATNILAMKKFIEQLCEDEFPLSALRKLNIQDRATALNADGQTSRSNTAALQTIGDELVLAAAENGHVLAHITAGVRKLQTKNKAEAAQHFREVYTLTPQYFPKTTKQNVKSNEALISGAERQLTALNPAAAALQTLIVTKVDIASDDEAPNNTLATGAINSKLRDTDTFGESLSSLIDLLQSLENPGQWAALVANCVKSNAKQLKPENLSDLVTLYSLMSDDAQRSFEYPLLSLAYQASAVGQMLDPMKAGQGALAIALIAATTEDAQKELATTIGHQFHADALSRVVFELGVKPDDSADKKITQPLEEIIRTVMFSSPTESAASSTSNTTRRLTFGRKKHPPSGSKIATADSQDTTENNIIDTIKEKLTTSLHQTALGHSNPLDKGSIPMLVDAAIDTFQKSVGNQLTLLEPSTKRSNFSPIINACIKKAVTLGTQPVENSTFRATLMTYVDQTAALVASYDLSSEQHAPGTFAAFIHKIFKAARLKSHDMFLDKHSGMIDDLIAKAEDQGKAIFQGVLQGLLTHIDLLPKDSANNNSQQTYALLYAERLLNKFQLNINTLNSPKNFLAIAEMLVLLAETEPTRAAEYAAQLLKAMKPEHLPPHDQLTSDEHDLLLKLISLSYQVSKKTSEDHDAEYQIELANFLDWLKSATDGDIEKHELVITGAISIEEAKDYRDTTVEFYTAQVKENAQQITYMDEQKSEHLSIADKKSLDHLEERYRAKLAGHEGAEANYKNTLLQSEVKDNAALLKAMEAYVTAKLAYDQASKAFKETEENIKSKITAESGQSAATILTNEQFRQAIGKEGVIDVLELLSNSLTSTMAYVESTARSSLPAPANDPYEKEIQRIIESIVIDDKVGSFGHVAVDQLRKNLEFKTIKTALSALDAARKILADKRQTIREAFTSRDETATEETALAEKIQAVRSCKKLAELPIRMHVYETHGVPPKLAESMYPTSTELPASFRQIVRDMINSAEPSLEKNVEISAWFNQAITGQLPIDPFGKVYPALLLATPSQLYGLQRLGLNFVDHTIGKLLDNGMSPTIRVIVLSALFNMLSSQENLLDCKAKLSAWLLTTLTLHCIKRHEEHQPVKIIYESEETKLHGELAALANKLWLELVKTVPPVIVTDHLDRLYRKQRSADYKQCAKHAKNVSSSTDGSVSDLLDTLQKNPQKLAHDKIPDALSLLIKLFREKVGTITDKKIGRAVEKAIETSLAALSSAPKRKRRIKKFLRKRKNPSVDEKVKQALKNFNTINVSQANEECQALSHLINQLGKIYFEEMEPLGNRTAYEKNLPKSYFTTALSDHTHKVEDDEKDESLGEHQYVDAEPEEADTWEDSEAEETNSDDLEEYDNEIEATIEALDNFLLDSATEENHEYLEVSQGNDGNTETVEYLDVQPENLVVTGGAAFWSEEASNTGSDSAPAATQSLS
jgi:hypothetical protein